LNAFFNNLSGFLQLFIPLFLFFSLVGTVTGYGMRDEVVTEALLKNFLIKEDNNVYVMEFTCAENNLGYIHSIDTNKITPLGNLSAQIDYRSTALEFPTDRYSKYRTLVSSILGGTTGGFQLSSALKKPPGGWTGAALRKTIIGIIGSISGFSTGYWVGSHYDTDCDSALAFKILDDTKTRIHIEQARLRLQLLALKNLQDASVTLEGNAYQAWGNDPAFVCSKTLADEKQRLVDYLDSDFDDPQSKHFKIIDQITQLHNKITLSPDYRILVENNLYQHEEKLNQYNDTDGLGRLIERRRKEWQQACAKIALIDI